MQFDAATTRACIGETTDLIRTIAPDAKDIQVYVCPRSSAPDRLVDHAEKQKRCFGLFTPLMDVALRDHLMSRGEWLGPGVAWYIDDVRIAEASCDHEEYRTGFIGICLHEFAHALCNNTWSHTFKEELVTPDLDVMDLWLRCVEPTADDDEPRELWLDHGQDFVRACCHLWHRASRLIDIAPRNLAFAGRRYGLIDAERYIASLGRELNDRSGEPIREILATSPPGSFERLWRFNTEPPWQPETEPEEIL